MGGGWHGVGPECPVYCFVLTEAPAIWMHLALSYPAAHLAPAGPHGLVRAIEWFNGLSGTVHAVAVAQIWRTERFSDDPAHHPGIVTKGKAELIRAFETIENRMLGQEWVVGQDCSVLDPYLLVFYRWGHRMGFDMRAQYPHWTKHALRMQARPAVQRALATEGVSLWG